MGSHDGRLWVVTTTFAGRDQAETIVTGLVEEGLAACAQVGGDLTSFYRWRGRTEFAQEAGVVLKVRDDRLDACLARLAELHPYEVPQITAWPAARVGEAYGRWAWGEEA